MSSRSSTLPSPGSIAADIAAVWRALLAENGVHVPALHPRDDVFALGATSLDALSAAAAIDARFSISFPEDQLFLRPTVAGQAALVAEILMDSLGSAPTRGMRERVDIRLVRTARVTTPVKSAVLLLPATSGKSVFAGNLAANSLAGFGVWTCEIDVSGLDMREEAGMFTCARLVAARLAEPDAPRPRALIVFSLGACLAWLVNHMLFLAGHPQIPIINLDGIAGTERVPPHWRLLPQMPPTQAPAAPMLLLHRADPGVFGALPLVADWAARGVAVIPMPCRTVAHTDFVLPAFFSAHDETMRSFIEAGGVPKPAPPAPDMHTPGGALFRLLAADEAPTARSVGAFVAFLPAGAIDFDLRLGLLYITLACGNPDLVRTVTERLISAAPELSDAVYAEVAWLTATGEGDAARARAAAWCAGRADAAMLRPPGSRAGTASVWNGGHELLWGDPQPALDIAAAFGAHQTSAPRVSVRPA